MASGLIYLTITEMAQDATHMWYNSTKAVTEGSTEKVSSIIKKTGCATIRFIHTRRRKWTRGCKIRSWRRQYTSRWPQKSDKRIKAFTKINLILSRDCRKVRSVITSRCCRMNQSHQRSSRIRLQSKYKWIGSLQVLFNRERLQSSRLSERRHRKTLRELKKTYLKNSKSNRRKEFLGRCPIQNCPPIRTTCPWSIISAIWGRVKVWVGISLRAKVLDALLIKKILMFFIVHLIVNWN